MRDIFTAWPQVIPDGILLLLTVMLAVTLVVFRDRIHRRFMSMDTSKRWRYLVRFLFWILVFVSGIAGIKITRIFSYQILMAAPFLSNCWPLSLLALEMAFASISFLVLYRVLALSIVATFERKHGMESYRPSAVRGMIFSALIPLILGILVLVLIFFIAHSGMHDSM
jgi:hypothetical protein